VHQDPRVDIAGPVLASLDSARKQADQYTLPPPFRPGASVDMLARFMAGETALGALPSPDVLHVGKGVVTPVDNGLALVGDDGRILWFFHPFPKPATYEEAKYGRPCKNVVASADGKWLLASFYNLIPIQGAPASVNRGDVALLEAATGREAARLKGYMGSQMAVARDASRMLVLDLVGLDERYRSAWGPHGPYVLAAFARDGRELWHLKVDPAVERLRMSDNARLAALSYSDARRYVSVIDADTGGEVRVPYGRVDTGVAVAPDGAFAAIAYSDRTVHKIGRDGKRLWSVPLPAPGVPAVLADGTIVAACDDGNVYLLTPDGKVGAPMPFADAPATALPATWDRPPQGLAEPDAPFWEQLAETVGRISVPGAPFAETTDVRGKHEVSVDVPEMGDLDVLLVSFDYQLGGPDDRLTVTRNREGRDIALAYPYRAAPQRVGVPLRPGEPGPVTLAFSARTAKLGGGRLVLLKLDDLGNAAFSQAGIDSTAANPAAPRVMIPNVFGLVGDPRREQMAYGFDIPRDAKLQGPLPPGVTRQAKTVPATYVDGDLYAATPLYPTIFPMNQPWDPPLTQQNLRSAQIILEYSTPRAITGIGIWEHPDDFPVRTFTLEACDTYEVDRMTRQLEGDWQLVCVGSGNVDYFHMQTFDPVRARVWRYTILQTASPVQRIAEIELYEDVLDAMELDMGAP